MSKPRKKTSRPPPSSPPSEGEIDIEVMHALSLPQLPPDGTLVSLIELADDDIAIVTYELGDPGDPRQLTAAETEIARALLAGLSNADIARERGSAERTVANQVASIYRKLAVRSRAELAARFALVSKPTSPPASSSS